MKQQTESPLILVIDDEEAILKTIKDALTDEGYRVEICSKGERAINLIGKLIPDLLMLDIFMPNCNGLTLLSQIKKEFPAQKVIIISGFGTIPIAIEAIQNGAIDFIEKPFNLDDILNKIEFLKTGIVKKDDKEIDVDKKLLNQIGVIGESDLFLELIRQVERLAQHSFPILLYGENGTGKSLIAHYIHKKSLLAANAFVEISLGQTCLQTNAVSYEDLKGSETKTVYLKNVDKLTPSEQKALLEAIEKSENKRIIASSSSSLFHLMQQGKFNQSLFSLLNKAPVEIPPLRKRPYDIPLLVHHYLSVYNGKHHKNVAISNQDLRALRNCSWNGNIFELKQVIENAVIKERLSAA
jgi:two-component system, NtrC family, nitrogen regulation response regulator NtrX